MEEFVNKLQDEISVFDRDYIRKIQVSLSLFNLNAI